MINSLHIIRCRGAAVDEEDEVSIEYVARAIAKAFNFKGVIEFDTTKADGQFKKTASNKKLRSLYPGYEFTKFDDAITDTVQWFLNNQDKVRKWLILQVIASA